MQQLCALLSGGSLAYKLWKNDTYATPGRVLDVKETGIVDFLKELKEKEAELEGFEFRLALCHTEFTLSSSDSGDDQAIALFKKSNILWKSKELKVDTYPGLGIKCTYSYDKTLVEELQNSGFNPEIVHYIPVLLHGISNLEREQNSLFCSVTEKMVSIIYLDGKKIKFAKCYEVNFPEDILYYLKLASEQVNSDLSEMNLFLMGRIHRHGQLNKLLKPFVKTISYLGKEKEEYIFKDISWIKECV